MTPRDIGLVLATLRSARGVGQMELCKRIGCSQAQLSRLESGKNTLTVRFLAKWCEAVGADLKIAIIPRKP